MFHIQKSLALLLLTCLSLCSAQTDCFGEGAPSLPNSRAVQKGEDDFSIKLFTDIALAYPYNSIVISPYSIWSVLNLAYFGAKGATESQLQKALGVPSKADAFYGGKIVEGTLQLNRGTTFNKADKAYFSINTELRDCAINKLTEIERVNFSDSQAAADKINGDVSLATKGKIRKFLSPGVITNAEFVLINAVYFKGPWKVQFLPISTKVLPFYDETGKVNISTATIMHAEAEFPYAFSERLGAAVLQLPYENSNISMLLILPEPGEGGINSVLKKISSDILDQVSKSLKERKVVVKLPRFKMTTRIADELKAGLTNLGITDLFTSAADLSNFMTSKGLFVDKSLHHATIEVTEEGTVAAAVTGLIGTRIASSVTTFDASRPFIFLIRDMHQGVTLFIGVLRNPNHTSPF